MLRFQLITPDRVLYEGDAESVSLPTPQGEITVLPHHIPLISIVVPGTLVVRGPQGGPSGRGEEHVFAVSRGVVEVDGASLRILADTADRADELQEEAIRQAKAEAERLRKEKRDDLEGFAEATAVMEREIAKLAALRRKKARGKQPRIEQ